MSALNVSAEEAQIIQSALSSTAEQQKSFHGYVDPALADLAAKVAEQIATPPTPEVKQVSPATGKTKASKQ
ncbi:hypothetical protein UFOVP393_20 [uncultured Caudovirales phage]|uniref:Uncharacterized protein n=1 Tax=uncultured Caudovirales phage TaxID=2100421 RepID=A0A6J7X0H6_9CAUD|nr:hypothetical protein UFOVP393_20 [uncultured Caudovirales phage]